MPWWRQAQAPPAQGMAPRRGRARSNASTSSPLYFGPDADGLLLGRQRDHRLLVAAAAHPALREKVAGGDPVERFLEHLLGVGLEHEALARTPAARIHEVVEAGRHLLCVVMGVELGPQIDVALRPAQGAEIFAYIFRIRVRS